MSEREMVADGELPASLLEPEACGCDELKRLGAEVLRISSELVDERNENRLLRARVGYLEAKMSQLWP